MAELKGHLPNFIIVGAMRAGTTTFSLTLQHHPDIYLPDEELHFFDIPERYTQGAALYKTYFSGAKAEKAIGEKTPLYCYDPGAPERIKAMLPQVKLIWLFRDPVARAYSHYLYFISIGRERLPFEAAIQREKKQPGQNFILNYVDRSIYVKQIEHYLRYFPREQMLFLLFEEFIKNPSSVLRQTCAFLDVDTEPATSLPILHENRSLYPRSILLQYAAFHLFQRRGTRLLNLIRSVNRRFGSRTPPKMSADTRAELRQFFAPYNQQLAQLTGLDVSIWENSQK